MSAHPDPRKTGAFVLTALFAILFAFIAANKDRFFSHTIKYVLYFQGTVKGLNIGSPVMFNGVPIGRVIGISLITNMKTLDIRIPVYIEIDRGKFVLSNKKASYEGNFERTTKELIDRGLRARLATQSLLTGQSYISLAFLPGSPAEIIEPKSPLPELPTLPSTGEEILQTLQRLPLQTLFDNMNATLGEIQALLKTLNAETPEITADAKDITASLKNITRKTEDALTSFDPNSRTMNDLNKMMRNFSAAAQALKNWADYLERHPEALLKGKARY